MRRYEETPGCRIHKQPLRQGGEKRQKDFCKGQRPCTEGRGREARMRQKQDQKCTPGNHREDGILSASESKVHVERRQEPRRRVPYARQLETPLQMLEKNWSGQSLIRFMRSYHGEKTEEIHTMVEGEKVKGKQIVQGYHLIVPVIARRPSPRRLRHR